MLAVWLQSQIPSSWTGPHLLPSGFSTDLERLCPVPLVWEVSSISGLTIFSVMSVSTVKVGSTMKSIKPAGKWHMLQREYSSTGASLDFPVKSQRAFSWKSTCRGVPGHVKSQSYSFSILEAKIIEIDTISLTDLSFHFSIERNVFLNTLLNENAPCNHDRS